MLVLLCGCANSIPSHLYSNAFPSDPNILSRVCGEKYLISFVEHVIGDEKYECSMFHSLEIRSRSSVGNVYCVSFRGSVIGMQYLYH